MGEVGRTTVDAAKKRVAQYRLDDASRIADAKESEATAGDPVPDQPGRSDRAKDDPSSEGDQE
jgi:hypothetical protein